jgi:hypothetical protein
VKAVRPVRIIIPLTTITDTFYMAACRDCARDLPLPFDAEIERDEWAAVHIQATSHRHRVDRYIELHGRGDGE